MNQKTAKLIRKVFGLKCAEAMSQYNLLSAKERKEVRERMQLYIDTTDKETLFSASHILSDVKLEE